MKLALLVLGCFVCASQQERFIWPFPIDPNQAAYKPLYYSDGLPAGYDVVKKSDVNPKDEKQSAEVIPRNNAPQRLFLNANSIYLFTTTTTLTSVVTSTATTAAVVKCIPAAQFSATTACARRRRDVKNQLLVGDEIEIKPDLPKPLETSVIADDVPAVMADIISSQKEEALEPSIADYSTYQQRAAFTTTVSATSYTTTYAFVATSITSTTSLGIAAGLLCLPSGFVICT
ncbi:uncharacterized protein LOC124198839 [Daphnia pulex]|uniref:uncharacterized protein LOC124198839 n=1 Tax=Daphnia pulex TaxID=6669 RepID=UPI001EDD4AFD|nr:uncharacterized protein LOC124198839 [Daphnia pulex]